MSDVYKEWYNNFMKYISFGLFAVYFLVFVWLVGYYYYLLLLLILHLCEQLFFYSAILSLIRSRVVCGTTVDEILQVYNYLKLVCDRRISLGYIILIG